MSEKIRLQKFLSQCGVASRRSSEELITGGNVRVDNMIVTELGTKIDPLRQKISVNGRVVHSVEPGIILLNKPKNVITSMYDPHGRKTVADLITNRYRSYFPVGRLDYDSTGLVILTNDGEIASFLTHPRYNVEKMYKVVVEGHVDESVVRKIKAGVTLDDGMIKGNAEVIAINEATTTLQITITSGRNRIIRRLMEKLRHPVLDLTRIQHGPLRLPKMRPGDITKLSFKEYRKVKQWVEARKNLRE